MFAGNAVFTILLVVSWMHSPLIFNLITFNLIFLYRLYLYIIYTDILYYMYLYLILYLIIVNKFKKHLALIQASSSESALKSIYLNLLWDNFLWKISLVLETVSEQFRHCRGQSCLNMESFKHTFCINECDTI